eukprot:scaffold2.g6802.t1
MAEDEKSELFARLDQLSPEERAAVRAFAAEQLMRQRRVKVGGKVMSLKALRDKVLRMKADLDRGVYEESIRTVPRWVLQATAPSTELRPGAHKQLLRKEEEEQLALDRIGQGAVYSASCTMLDRAVQRFNPLHKRDFCWGMYARPEEAERALSRRWAGREPDEVLSDGRFYYDILRHCHQMELTLMVLASRPLPLAPLRERLAGQLSDGVAAASRAEGAETDQADLQRFIRLWDDERLQRGGLVDGRGRVKEGTHFVLTATPRGVLTVEAISAGPLSERVTSVIGTNSNPTVTASLFGLFLGPRSLDEGGRLSVANGMLWAANGGRFRLGAGKRSVQHLAGTADAPWPKPQGEVLPASPSLFAFLSGGSSSQPEAGSRMLLSGIAQAQLAPDL